MKKLFWRAALILPLLWQTLLPAQTCAPGDDFPGPYICWPYITNITGSTEGMSPDGPSSGFCTTIENNAWFSFSPCLKKVSFAIVSSGCRNNAGLEAAIFDKNLNIVSNCFSSAGINLSGTITAENLDPGEVYYFMIDGFQGDQCEYILTGIEGLNPPGPPIVNSQTGYIAGESEVCAGSAVNYSAVPPVCNIIGSGLSCPLPNLSAYYDTIYHWTVPPGAVIVSDSTQSDITVRWDNVQTGLISVSLEVISSNNSCTECAGGLPGFACSSEILPIFISVKPPYYTNLQQINLCAGECYKVGNETYCDSGHYEIPFTASDGCDSFVVFDIVVDDNIINRLPEKYVCDGDCITVAGEVFCNEGEYEIHLNSAAGCDSLIIFEIIQLDEPIEHLPPMSFCEGSCFEINGREFCESGTYQIGLQTVDGCDSIVVFDIEILKKSQNILPPVEICEDDCYDFEGQLICEPGIFEFYRINNAGCDSLIILEIIQNKTDKIALPRIRLCEGQTFELGGQTFDKPGIGEVVFQNKFGCDSTVMFDLEFRKIEVDFPTSVILSPDQPFYQIIPDLGNTNRANLKIEWQGFQNPYNTLNQQVDTSGLFTLTLTDTILGCSTTKTIEVFELNRECQSGLFISPSPNCETAPFLCGEFLDGFCSSTDAFKQFTLRGNVRDIVTDSIENPKWLRWSPCAETAVFRIGVKESQNQKGIAFSVLQSDDCETYESLINSEKIEGISIKNITVDGLIPGEIYQFLFDGIDADICEFQIEIIEGVSKEPLEWEMISPPQIIGNTDFCPGVSQTFTLIPPVCRVMNGNCAFAGELMIMNPQQITWNLPQQAKVVDDINSNTIEILFEEDALLPRGAKYLPDGLLLSEMISVDIAGTMQLPDAVICTNEGTCNFRQSIQIEINHELEMLPTVDVCETSNYAFCGETITSSELKICRENCKTTVQKINVRPARRIDRGLIRICPGDCYTMPITKHEICEAGTYTFPILEKCGGTETVGIDFYDPEPITTGPITEICNPLNTGYRVSFDVSEGVPPYYVDGELTPSGRFLSDSIPNGEAYAFEISDASICKEKTYIDGRFNCGPLCRSDAGTMSQQIVSVCSDEVAQTDYNQNAILDSNDGHEFILHTSSTDQLGQILERTTEGDFVFQNFMEYDKIYYASSVVGTLNNGTIDLNDPCLAVSTGQPVIFKRIPGIQLDDELTLDCNNPTAVLSAEDLLADDHFSWTLPNGINSSEEVISVHTPGIYILNANADNGCSLSLTVSVSQNKILPVAEAGSDATIRCAQEFSILDAAGSSVGNEFTYEWNTINGEISGAINSLSAKAMKGGMYYFSVKNDVNGCEKTDSVFVEKSEKPTHSVEINTQAPSCFGLNDGTVEIKNITGGMPPYELSFDGAEFSEVESFLYLQSGTYEVLIRDDFGCILKKNISISEPPEVAVDLGDDQFITLGEQVLLTSASSINPVKIDWWSSAGDYFEGELQWEVRPIQSSTYFVRIHDEQGCFEEDEVNIIVKDADVFIPSGFSPNGDKNNDFFTIYAGESVEKIVSLRVYDRRGGLVFENKNFPSNIDSKGWDGNFKGKRMRADVFVYVVDVEFINGDVKTFRGDVTLIR